jgi:hypothetical protein
MATASNHLINTLNAAAIEDELDEIEQTGHDLRVAIGAQSNRSPMQLADAYGLGYLVDRIREIVTQIAAALESRPDLHSSLVDAAEVERHIIWLCLQVQAGYVEPDDSPCC